MRDPGLRRILRAARARGLRPFEIFAEGKLWVDSERLKARGLVDSILARTSAVASGREGEAREGIQRAARRGRPPAGEIEDEGVGCARDLRFAKGTHSHLLELRRSAIRKIRKEGGSHVQG